MRTPFEPSEARQTDQGPARRGEAKTNQSYLRSQTALSFGKARERQFFEIRTQGFEPSAVTQTDQSG